MEKYLDDLIKILEESLSNEDFNKTKELEKKLQNLTEDFRKTQDSLHKKSKSMKQKLIIFHY